MLIGIWMGLQFFDFLNTSLFIEDFILKIYIEISNPKILTIFQEKVNNSNTVPAGEISTGRAKNLQ